LFYFVNSKHNLSLDMSEDS